MVELSSASASTCVSFNSAVLRVQWAPATYDDPCSNGDGNVKEIIGIYFGIKSNRIQSKNTTICVTSCPETMER